MVAGVHVCAARTLAHPTDGPIGSRPAHAATFGPPNGDSRWSPQPDRKQPRGFGKNFIMVHLLGLLL